jgi:signal transduction histidine kinase
MSRVGVRGRVFSYFSIFTVLLLVLLWLFQIAFLPGFYRFQKTQVLRVAVQTLIDNINSDNIASLAERIAIADDLTVLITDDSFKALASTQGARSSVILMMNPQDRSQFANMAAQTEDTLYSILSNEGPKRETEEEDDRFIGPVPPQPTSNEQHMIAYRQAFTQSGEQRYIFVDVRITPVDATVQTLKSQYLFIAVFMMLLGALLSFVLSRRIAQPIIDTNDAAAGLALGRYTPLQSGVTYREIDQLNRTLAKAAEDLKRVEVMQRELIANISHDLRTPLTLIEGYAEAMRDLPGENSPENMQVIIDEAKRLTSLVNAVLEYSAIQSGHMTVTPTKYSITQSIRAILTRYQKLVEKEGYTIRFEPDCDLTAYADEMKIGQVIYNLVNNALTYTGEDKTVTVTQRVDGKYVRIEVQDTGAGIEPQELPHIWSRYYRGSKPHKRATVGSGLGLSIVRSILDAHGLPYGVQSQPDSGTVFWFTLLIAKPEAAFE